MMEYASPLDSKARYDLLDGLRGVAALLVVCYHIFEGYAFAETTTGLGEGLITTLNHGYLAVDFFFLLSGFVIAYAYDDRWARGFTLRGFARRRLVRLHPMVVMGAVIGAVCFAAGGAQQWDGTRVTLSAVMTALLLGMFLLPMPQGAACDVRGNGEMFPLNGPSWSLLFEYVGNICYALVLRRVPTAALAVLTLLLGAALTAFAVGDVSGYGCLGVGWTLDGVNALGGALRMLFPFTMGQLLARTFRPVAVRGAFWLCAALLLSVAAVPYFSDHNALYEMGCIALVFPAILLLGASGRTTDAFSTRVCRALGELSYPLYLVHYPLMYLFYAWLIDTRRTAPADTWPVAVATVAGSVALAWVVLRCYDLPVRRWLNGKK